jgi:hypothetical protein
VSRIAVVILVTVFAFAAPLILAGRTDWDAVSYRVASDAIDAIEVCRRCDGRLKVIASTARFAVSP